MIPASAHPATLRGLDVTAAADTPGMTTCTQPLTVCPECGTPTAVMVHPFAFLGHGPLLRYCPAEGCIWERPER
jgi:hypothetical protein